MTRPGSIGIRITADIASGTQPFARAITTLPLTIHPAAANQP